MQNVIQCSNEHVINGASENHSPILSKERKKIETANLARIFPLDAIDRLVVAWP